MPLNTDLNIKPYFDDYNENNNYHRILFRPHMAVQARELNQLQTILQNQIERFGDNILREGTIVTGGNFVEEKSLQFVRLQDLDSDELNPINVSKYFNKIAVGSVSGIRAQIIQYQDGLESNYPNTNTIWVKYLNTTTYNTETKTFLNGEDIIVYDDDGVTVIERPVALVTNAIGIGYGVRCGGGVIYQKGFFTRFEDQLTIVSKYDNKPDGIVVGFVTKEVIVNSFQDESLLDNANSFNNYNAPGADRLQLVPVLTAKTIEQGEKDETFFALQEYQGGRIVRRKLDTVYSVIGDVMARRRYEESGNYVVWGFDIGAEESTNANNITLTVGPGVGYVSGYRVDLNDTFKMDVPQGVDIETEINQNVLINYGNYVVVENMFGFINFEQIDTVDLKNSSNVTIGTARVRSVTTESMTDKTHRVYLFDIKMNTNTQFSNVRRIVNGTDGSADVVLNNFGNAQLYEGQFNSLVFPIGRSHIKSFNSNFTEYTYRTRSAGQITLAGTAQIAVSGTDEFPYGPGATLSNDQKKDIIMIVTNDYGDTTFPTGSIIDLSSATVTIDGTGKVMNIDLNAAPTVIVDTAVYYNVMKTNVKPIGKTLQDFTVTHNIVAGNKLGPWSLGVPDGYKLTEVTVNGTDRTSSFSLSTGQRDSYYGYSYLVRNGITLNVGDVVVTKFKAFTKQTTGLYIQSFFDADSYVSIPVVDIPVYTTESGIKINLRDAIDFRPYVARAPQFGGGFVATDPTNVETFPAETLYMAAPGTYVNVSYDYYLGRYDKLVMDLNGKLSVISGQAAVNPLRPPDPSEGIVLGTYYIPPYPSLPSIRANKLSLPNYAVRFSKKNNKRYTMADIRALDLRIQNIEYYTSLSLLENQTKDMVVLDGNGLNRFKNGIFVDPFRDLRIGDIYSPEFSAALDQFDTVIEPRHKIIPIDLKVASVSNCTDFGDVVTLSKEDYSIINQPYATAVKNCTTGLYNYRGEMYLIPDDDTAPDVVVAPDINIDIDLTTPFIEYTEGLWQVLRPQEGRDNDRNQANTTTANNIFRSIVTSGGSEFNSTLAINGFVNTIEVGDYVKDISIDPFMRSNAISVFVTGLRPNTRVWAYFDQKAVSQFCSPASYDPILQQSWPDSLQPTTSIQGDRIVATGRRGDPLYTNSNGEFYCIFNIPEETFKVGDRLFEIFDVDAYNSIDALTTYASKSYTAFNFSLEKSSLTVSTRNPRFTANTVVRQLPAPPADPLIQSFIIDPNAADESYTFISGVDLYFNSKSDVYGVTVSIREFKDGIPSGETLAHSSVHLPTKYINTSSTGTAVTNVKFNCPIPVRTNTEYGIEIHPDTSSPDFKLFICRTGEKDLISGISITQDTNSGMVFTSTNSRTFTPYQNENLKYTLYASKFLHNEGTVTLVPKEQEFLNLTDRVGNFIPGETVFVDNSAAATSGTISFDAANNIVSGNNTFFTTQLVSGDWIATKSTDDEYEILQVSVNGVLNNNQLRLSNYPTSSNTNLAWYKTVVGKVSVQIVRDDEVKLVLKNSSAKIGNVFSTGAKLIGARSGATATIAAVENEKVSFLQPNIRQLNFIETRTSMNGKMNNGVTTDSYYVPFNGTRYFKENEYYIPSHSNVVQGETPTEFVITLKNVSSRTPLLASPFIDHSISTILLYEYIVNSDFTDETTPNGNAISKYVSKIATLADEMDAVDFRLYLTAYRPSKTNIKVYFKPISISDGRTPYSIGWTEMVLNSDTDFFSNSADRYDYREFEYRLPTVASSNPDSASYDGVDFRYTDSNGVVYTNFKSYCIKVVMLSDTYSRAPRIDDIRGMALT